jgi:hypothetical protein
MTNDDKLQDLTRKGHQAKMTLRFGSLTLQNLRLEGKILRYEATKPFDTIANYAGRHLWLPLIDAFRNREIEFGFSYENIKFFFQELELPQF